MGTIISYYPIYFLTTNVDFKFILFSLLGGLAIFLFSMSFMSDNLKKIAGSKLRLILEKTTNSPIKGVMTGLVLTALIQSSSATTAIVVGLIGAGLLTLKNAVGVFFGANIGTTLTSLLISFNIGQYAYPIIFIGVILMMFTKKKKLQYIGGSILGFGLLFLGLNIMGDALSTVAKHPKFANLLISAGNIPVLGLLIGILTTVIVQSSSATIGILQTLYTTGTVPLVAAIAIVLGSNIGTTITAVLASLASNKDGKKAALINVVFNLLGSLLFLIIIRQYATLVIFVSKLFNQNPTNSMLTISLAHIMFNLITVFIFLWFVNFFVKLANFIIKDDDRLIEEIVLNKELVKRSPELALANANEAIIQMYKLTSTMLDSFYEYAFLDNDKAIEVGLQSEEILNYLDADIHNFLVDIGSYNLTERQMGITAKHIDTVKDLERIGDHIENLFEIFVIRKEEKRVLHDITRKEFLHLFEIIKEQHENSLTAYFNNDISLASKVEANEMVLNKLVKEYRSDYITRVSEDYKLSETSYYVDIISNIERIGDHCYNISEKVLHNKFKYTKKTVRA